MRVLLILVSVLFSSPTLANSYTSVGQFGWFAVGNTTQVSETQMYWTGEFSGTYFADEEGHFLNNASMRCPGSMEIDLANNAQKARGYCMFSDLNGNKGSFEWAGSGTIGDMSGSFTWISGDGPFSELVGQSGDKFRGITITNWADGMATGVAYWNK